MVRLYEKDGKPVVVARGLARFGVIAVATKLHAADTFELAPGLTALVAGAATRLEFDRAADPSGRVEGEQLPAGMKFYQVMLMGGDSAPAGLVAEENAVLSAVLPMRSGASGCKPAMRALTVSGPAVRTTTQGWHVKRA